MQLRVQGLFSCRAVATSEWTDLQTLTAADMQSVHKMHAFQGLTMSHLIQKNCKQSKCAQFLGGDTALLLCGSFLTE